MLPNDPRSWLQIAVAKPDVVLRPKKRREESNAQSYHGVPDAHLPAAGNGGYRATRLLYLSF